jgi:hypothetical protein
MRSLRDHAKAHARRLTHASHQGQASPRAWRARASIPAPTGASSTLRAVLPEADVAIVQDLCDGRVPDHARDQLRVELERSGQALTIFECRPPWREDYGPEWTRSAIAKLRYVGTTRLWTLYYCRHTGRWERYPLLGPTRRLGELLDELRDDPICIFWS